MKLNDLLVSESEVVRLITPLCETENVLETFAAAALSHTCEPGDKLAGSLTELIPMQQLLASLIHRRTANEISQLLDGQEQVLENDFNTSWNKLWVEALERWLPRLSLNSIRQNLQQFAITKGSLIDRESENFASNFADLGSGTPLIIWARGDASVLRNSNKISVVGSRIASAYGREITFDLATEFFEQGVTTVSGGAFGIDSLIHSASLELDSPTIAVLAGGLDNLYPRGNIALFERILKNNLIIAEVPPTVAPAKFRFLMRNRLIAALGDGTVVVEAGARSGSMSTANHALAIGRPVGVVPGRITDMASRGCLNLLRENAGEVQVLTCAKDALELIGMTQSNFEFESELGVLEIRALDAFGRKTLSSFDVQRIAGLTLNEVQLALGKLEIGGFIERQIDGYRKTQNNL